MATVNGADQANSAEMPFYQQAYDPPPAEAYEVDSAVASEPATGGQSSQANADNPRRMQGRSRAPRAARQTGAHN